MDLQAVRCDPWAPSLGNPLEIKVFQSATNTTPCQCWLLLLCRPQLFSFATPDLGPHARFRPISHQLLAVFTATAVSRCTSSADWIPALGCVWEAGFLCSGRVSHCYSSFCHAHTPLGLRLSFALPYTCPTDWTPALGGVHVFLGCLGRLVS